MKRLSILLGLVSVLISGSAIASPMSLREANAEKIRSAFGKDTAGWIERVNRSRNKYDGFYSAKPNVNCRVAPSLRAPVVYVVPKAYTLLPWYVAKINPKNPNDIWLATSPGINQICWMHKSVIGGEW